MHASLKTGVESIPCQAIGARLKKGKNMRHFQYAGFFWVYNPDTDFLVCMIESDGEPVCIGPLSQWSFDVQQAAKKA